MNFLVKTVLLSFMGALCSSNAMDMDNAVIVVVDNKDIAALFIAVCDDSVEEICTIAHKNPYIVNVRSSLCAKTPLHLAVAWNRKKAAQALMQCGASVNMLDEFHNIPFFYAKDEEMKKILLNCTMQALKQ